MAGNQDVVKGKSALITGGGSGINLEFARLLLERGCSVIIGDIQLRPEAQSLLSEYPHPPTDPSKPSAVFHKTDVTSWPNLSSLFDKAVESFPTVDIVVPGAGLFEPSWSTFWNAPKSDTNPDSVSRDVADGEPGHYSMIDVNLTHPIRLSQLALSHWTLKKKKGALVFIGSIAGYTAAINTPLYFATKHGLHGFVRSLGGLKNQLGIRSGCVAPGAVRTPLLMEDPTKSGMHSELAHMAEPREVAEAMFQLTVSEEYGDGTILECTKGETRLIPEWGLTPPGGKGASMPGYVNAANAVFEDLRTKGLQV